MKLYLDRGLSGLNGEAHWTVGSKKSISKFLTATVLCRASLLSSSLNEYNAAPPSPSPNAAARRAARPPPPELRRETNVTDPASCSSLPEDLEKCPKGLTIITFGCRPLSRRHLVIVLMRPLLTCDVAMLHQIRCLVENTQSRWKQDITVSNTLYISKSFWENVNTFFFKYESVVKCSSHMLVVVEARLSSPRLFCL